MSVYSIPNFGDGGVLQATDSNAQNTIVLRDNQGSTAVNVLTANRVAIGGETHTVNAATTTITVATTDSLIIADAGGGAITLNLPAASTATGMTLTVVRKSASNNVVLDGASSETINGSATKTLTTQYASLTIVCDGSAWYITAHEGTIT
jgi:hypothetical protein